MPSGTSSTSTPSPSRHARVGDEAGQYGGGLLREREAGDSGARPERPVAGAEHDGDDRLVEVGRSSFDRLARGVDVVGRRWRVDDEHGVDVVARQRGPHGSFVVVGRAVPAQCDGWRHRCEPGGGERRLGQHSRAARVAQHGDAIAAHERLAGEHPGGVEQRRHRRDLDHTGLAVQGCVAGVEQCGPGAHGDDRTCARHPTCDPRELARIAERLGVQRDHGGGVVVLPELEEIVGREVVLVAQRDEPGQPEVELGGLAQQR